MIFFFLQHSFQRSYKLTVRNSGVVDNVSVCLSLELRLPEMFYKT